ncbi:MAG TPA: hypothetical protein VJ547_12620 [Candidatus Thermoplasmatota archaeon]|nr:hypothetical protein [Candidatus Thermoplasmatota archaeon]
MPKRGAATRGPKKASRKRKAGKAPKENATASARYADVRHALESEVIRLFPDARPASDYNMAGWRIPRPRRIESWKGTIDPNFVHIFLAERKNGITLHFWNPYNPYGLKQNAASFEAAGFKVMVGCLQFNRKGEFPMAAVTGLLERVRGEMDGER